ncbi:hypothetical protein niasHS_001882 [Heterodera schachtii]|uniref:Uncharacterized protein n=1 Tax=Heterodera schachtii TaxID=97005 RepID=A0ABD2KAQ9_HETSC
MDLQLLMGPNLRCPRVGVGQRIDSTRELFRCFCFVPFSLFPSPFPRALFHKAVDVQKSLQLLYFRAMRDFDFLKDMHRAIIETNEKFRQMADFTNECIRQQRGVANEVELGAFSKFIITSLWHTQSECSSFTLPGVVERFFPRPEEAHMAIRKVLTKSWSIGEGDEEAEKIIKKVRINPKKYVMKWNDCGQSMSGKKICDNEIIDKLEKMTNLERNNFIIMEKLKPAKVKDGTVLQQFSGEAHQMKTKLASENEGGVWKGQSVCDSPLLV